jgi:GH24 family phage-related lysozyme (muramidase)
MAARTLRSIFVDESDGVMLAPWRFFLSLRTVCRSATIIAVRAKGTQEQQEQQEQPRADHAGPIVDHGPPPV